MLEVNCKGRKTEKQTKEYIYEKNNDRFKKSKFKNNKKKTTENSTELQKPNVDAEVDNNNKIYD